MPTPYNVCNGDVAAGTTTYAITVGTGTGSPTGAPAGDLVYVIAGSGASTPTSITDSKGNTWVAGPAPSGSVHEAMWSSILTSALVSGTDTITVTFSSTSGVKFIIAKGCTGVASATADKTNSATGTSTAPSSGSSGTLTQANELVVGGIFYGGTGTTFSGQSFGTPLSLASGAGQLTEIDEIVSATTAQTASGTLSASVSWAALVSTFKLASSATVSLSPATITIATPGPTAVVTVPLSVATVSISAVPVTPNTGGSATVNLGTATVSIAAYPVTPTFPGKTLMVSIASMAGVDPITGMSYPAGFYTNQGTFEGSDFVLNSNGYFLYSGTPANGNLVSTVAASGGTDSYGNEYLAGVVSYGVSGGVYTACQLRSGGTAYYTASGSGGPWSYTSQITTDSSGDLTVSTIGNVIFQVDNGLTQPFQATLSSAGLQVDSWHSLGSLGQAGIALSVMNYRLLADGGVELDIRGNATASLTGGSNSFPHTLPSAYRPSTALAAVAGKLVNSFAWAEITTGGSVSLHWPTTSGTGTIAVNGRYFPS